MDRATAMIAIRKLRANRSHLASSRSRAKVVIVRIDISREQRFLLPQLRVGT